MVNAVVAGAIAMILGLIVVPLVSLCTYKLEVKKGILDTEKVANCFAGYEGRIVVSAKDSIGYDAEAEEEVIEEIKEEISEEKKVSTNNTESDIIEEESENKN